jgi:hypothetical protein
MNDLYGSNDVKKFCEKEARLGSMGGMNGNELFSKVGFVK